MNEKGEITLYQPNEMMKLEVYLEEKNRIADPHTNSRSV